MFTHILVPTDGSKLSEKAVKSALEFAKALVAKVTVLHVTPQFRMVVGGTPTSALRTRC